MNNSVYEHKKIASGSISCKGMSRRNDSPYQQEYCGKFAVQTKKRPHAICFLCTQMYVHYNGNPAPLNECIEIFLQKCSLALDTCLGLTNYFLQSVKAL